MAVAERGAQAAAKNRSFLILGGSLASNRGMQKMAEPFIRIVGADHVRVYNSEISFDKPNPGRYAQQAKFSIDQLRQGRDQVILTDNTGLQSYGRMLKKERKIVNGFRPGDNAEKMTIIASEPLLFNRGFRGARERAALVVNSIRRQTNPTVLGIDAVTAFPPVGITDQQIQEHLGEWQRTHPSVPVMDVPRQSDQRKRPEAIADALAANDRALVDAVERGNGKDVLKTIEQRGAVAKNEVKDIFAGKDTPSQRKEEKATRLQMVKSALPLVGRIFSGAARKDIRRLANDGARVVLVHFINDHVSSLDASVRLQEKMARRGKEIEVVVLNRFGNAGSALDHKAYATAVQGLLETKVQPVHPK